MLDLPWWVADRDLAAGDVITIGRTVDGQAHPPVSHDVTYIVAQDVPAGTILGVGTDGRLHRLPPAERTPARASHQRSPRRSA
jgi:hypothetical protein